MLLLRQLIAKPGSCIGLAGGNTTRPIHQEIVRLAEMTGTDFSQAHFFSVDEYADAPRTQPGTCYRRMAEQLFIPLGVSESHIHCFDPESSDAQGECERVRADIARLGGVDLQYLGLGVNGHVGFNNPGTPFGSVAYSFSFTQAFRREKAAMFGGLESVPDKGVTLGLADCMHSRKVLLVANDSSKADILKKVVYGPVTEEVPASVLQLHPNAVILAGEAAGAAL